MEANDPIDVVSKLKGFKLEDAENLLKIFGWSIRLVRVADVACNRDDEYDGRRVNVEIENYIIMKVINIG